MEAVDASCRARRMVVLCQPIGRVNPSNVNKSPIPWGSPINRRVEAIGVEETGKAVEGRFKAKLTSARIHVAGYRPFNRIWSGFWFCPRPRCINDGGGASERRQGGFIWEHQIRACQRGEKEVDRYGWTSRVGGRFPASASMNTWAGNLGRAERTDLLDVGTS